MNEIYFIVKYNCCISVIFKYNIHFVFLLLNIRNFLQQHLQGNAHALFVAETIKESLEILNFKEFMINDESKV